MDTFKRCCRAAHRAAGLVAGVLLVLLGLTGSVNVFAHDLDAWLHPHAHAAGPSKSAGELLAAAQQSEPQRRGSWLLIQPHHPGGAAMAWYEDTAGFHQPLMLTIDSQTAQVLETHSFGGTLLELIFHLHATLLLGEPGYDAVGLSGLLLLALMLLALPLAFPKASRWRDAFQVRLRKGPARRNYDLHRAAGVWSFVPLAVVAVTGFCIVYPDASARFVSGFSAPRQPAPTLRSDPAEGPAIGANEAVALAMRELPEAALRTVRTPLGADGVWEIGLRQPGDRSGFFPSSKVWVSQYAPRVVGARDQRRFSNGEGFLAIAHSLHSGAALGLPGRITVFATGLVPAALFVTGSLAWLRRRARRKQPGLQPQPLRIGATT